jgi:hypothetical protein
MDDRQTRVFRVLDNKSRKLSGVYRAALDALGHPSFEGGELPRLSVICHCLRELTNGAPEILAEIADQRPNPSASSIMGKIPDLMEGVDLDLDQDLIPIPRSAAAHLRMYLDARTKETGRNRRLARTLITRSTEVDSPAISQWMKAQRFFEKWHHLDRYPDGVRQIPDDQQVRDHLRIIEDVIESQYGFFFDGLHAIEDLLARANDTGEATE